MGKRKLDSDSKKQEQSMKSLEGAERKKSRPYMGLFERLNKPKIHETEQDNATSNKVELATATSSKMSKETKSVQKNAILRGLIQSGLGGTPEKQIQYAEEVHKTQQSLYDLENMPYDEIENAIKDFNRFLSEEYLLPNGSVSGRTRKSEKIRPSDVNSNFFEPLDSKIIDDSLRLVVMSAESQANNTKNNLLYAFLTAYDHMSKNYNQHRLSYHGFRHALEAVSDVSLLISQRARLLYQESLRSQPDAGLKLADFELERPLMILLVLFHDIQFTFNRVEDEVASADILKIFLSPVLNHLSSVHKKIITDLMQIVIPGASTPAFIKKDATEGGETIPVLSNVYEVANLFRRESMPTDSKSKFFCAWLAQLMMDVDKARTCIPSLFPAKAQEFESLNEDEEKKMLNAEHWEILKLFYPEEVRNNLDNPVDFYRFSYRITQGLRALEESLVASITDDDLRGDINLMSPACKVVRLITHYQHYKTELPVEINENDIKFLAEKIAGEGHFSGIMKNSCNPIYPELRNYEFINDWDKHGVILLSISLLLQDSKVTFETKKNNFLALVHVVGEQEGAKDMIDKIFKVADRSHEVIKRQLDKESTLYSVSSPMNCGCLG